MVSNRESKFIKSLQLKKFRSSEGKFLVEGAKNVLELIESDLEKDSLYVTRQFSEDNLDCLRQLKIEITEVKEADLIKIGTFKSNNAALAVANIPNLPALDLSQDLTLALDRIKDPGNLGTIIRIADWYGIKNIVCSEDSVDCFNPKVVAATMGSFTRVKVYYQSLEDLVRNVENVYATSLEGKNLHHAEFSTPAVVLLGNESSGLGDRLADLATRKIKIPGYGGAESLNVAVSTAVFCDNFIRMIKK